MRVKQYLPTHNLADKHTLPCSKEEVVKDVDMALISHMHTDYFDLLGQKLLPKDIPLFCQDVDKSNIKSIKDSFIWEGITTTRMPSRHGTGNVLKEMGDTSGFVLHAKDEPILYWMGETIWCKEVEATSRISSPISSLHTLAEQYGEMMN